MALDKAAFLQAQTAHANLATRPRRVAALGDSITANNHLGIGTGNITKSSRGYMTFAEVLSRRAWYWDETLISASPGRPRRRSSPVCRR